MAHGRLSHSRRMAVMTAVLVLVLLVAMLPATALAAPEESSKSFSGWGCSTYYTVQHGDTLSGIARWYGVSVHALAQANHISNPNRIFAGQTLCIPSWAVAAVAVVVATMSCATARPSPASRPITAPPLAASRRPTASGTRT